PPLEGRNRLESDSEFRAETYDLEAKNGYEQDRVVVDDTQNTSFGNRTPQTIGAWPPAAGLLRPPLAAGAVYEDAAHGLGRRGEEVAGILEMLIAHQSQVGFVDQCCRLQRLAGPLPRHLLRRQLAQLI